MAKIYGLELSKIREIVQKKDLSVGIVGFGYIGSCIGGILADKGLKVTCIDTNKEIIKEVNNGAISINEPGLKELIKKGVQSGRLDASSDFSCLSKMDVIIITVGTPLSDEYSADMSHLISASESVSKFLKKGQLVILKSTIPPYTTEDIVKPALEKSGLKASKDFGIVFSPERLAEGNALKEFMSIPIVVGGIDNKSLDAASCFWECILNVEVIKVSNARTAEMVKLADNLWIDLNIALGNEMAKLSDKMDIDVMEVINAANTLPKVDYNVNILMPSMGVGGYCLTKDPWFIHHIGKKYGLDIKTPITSREINCSMPLYTFELIRSSIESQDKALNNSKVAVLGLSFKSNTGDCRFTPTKHVIKLLEESGCKLSIYDPRVIQKDANDVTKIPMSDSIEDAVRGADCIAFFTGHEEFKKFPIKDLKNLANSKCSLIDGRNIFSNEDVQQIKKVGFIYQGIGKR